MSVLSSESARPRSLLPVALVVVGLAVLAAGVISGASTRAATVLLVLATLAALARTLVLGWRLLIAALILVILFIPIRKYALPASLPFELEPYRVLVAVVVAGWVASLLVDPRVRLRRTGFEAPLALVGVATFASVVANPDRVALFTEFVNKKLMFFLSFVLVLYVIASVVRRLDNIDFIVKTLVAGGAFVALLAIVEARTGFNAFDHVARVIPILHTEQFADGGFLRFGAAKQRVFGSAEHPIALSAALVMLTPLAIYLARRYRQRRWTLCAILLAAACAATVSRTGVLMFVVVLIVFLWLRPRETVRLWPAAVVALVVVKLVLPGTLGAIKQSFQPPGGLLAEQRSMAGTSGSGRLADLGPALQEWKRQPLVGQGFGTRVVDGQTRGPRANILDNQWLGTLLETGALGFFAWLWFFGRVVRRFGAEARRDDSERGWLLVSIAASVAAFAVGMFTYDAFSFIQVTFLLFIFVGLGSALMAERPTPLAAREKQEQRRQERLDAAPLPS